MTFIQLLSCKAKDSAPLFPYRVLPPLIVSHQVGRRASGCWSVTRSVGWLRLPKTTVLGGPETTVASLIKIPHTFQWQWISNFLRHSGTTNHSLYGHPQIRTMVALFTAGGCLKDPKSQVCQKVWWVENLRAASLWLLASLSWQYLHNGVKWALKSTLIADRPARGTQGVAFFCLHVFYFHHNLNKKHDDGVVVYPLCESLWCVLPLCLRPQTIDSSTLHGRLNYPPCWEQLLVSSDVFLPGRFFVRPTVQNTTISTNPNPECLRHVRFPYNEVNSIYRGSSGDTTESHYWTLLWCPRIFLLSYIIGK